MMLITEISNRPYSYFTGRDRGEDWVEIRFAGLQLN